MDIDARSLDDPFANQAVRDGLDLHEDGVLVNLNGPSFTFRPGLNICAEAGIKYPVAMTIAAYSKTVSEPGMPLPPGQDISGRLWDVLTMFKVAAKQGGEKIRFPVTVVNWVSVDGERINRTKRETVILKVYEGFKFEEIAEALECPVSTVKSRLYTALDILKEALAPIPSRGVQ